MDKFDFSGWATKINIKCSDGRTILKDAFKHHDGQWVPIVWNHIHSDPLNVLGKALLEHREEGIYTYGVFNDTEAGRAAKELVQHGDVVGLSICANQLKQNKTGGVMHGMIRELSLVIAGANPGAFIDTVIAHSDNMDDEEVLIVGYAEEEALDHSDDIKGPDIEDVEEELVHAEDEEKEKTMDDNKEKTVQEIIDTMNEEQQELLYGMVGAALEHSEEIEEPEEGDETPEEGDEINHSYEDSEGGNEEMKHNVFDNKETMKEDVLSHAAQMDIIEMAKDMGSLRKAIKAYAEDNQNVLAHGIDEIEKLFPDYKDVHPGAPELLERDQSWVGHVMKKAHKSPISRVRTRQADARANELRAKGYNDREVAKKLSGNIKLIMRTTDPQTVYRRDELHRDDITDITDFDVVAYQKTVMRHNLEEDIALAALIGDGREDTDQDKIHENHIRSIWNDEELYTIHADVDIEGARTEIQGSDTSKHFSENYIYAEAIIQAALYSREKYKGKGQLDFYCTPHLLNIMLLARDFNGRRIYDSKADLAKALNVGEIWTVEQFEGKTRTTKDGKTKKLLGIFVNMGNYQFGSTKGGEITNFEDFDIDFNKYKYLMETRLSGALTEVYSAIALEEPVTEAVAG